MNVHEKYGPYTYIYNLNFGILLTISLAHVGVNDWVLPGKLGKVTPTGQQVKL